MCKIRLNKKYDGSQNDDRNSNVNCKLTQGVTTYQHVYHYAEHKHTSYDASFIPTREGSTCPQVRLIKQLTAPWHN